MSVEHEIVEGAALETGKERQGACVGPAPFLAQ